MTIQGALSDLNNLLEADDIPFYYKTSIKKIIETIEQELKTGHWIVEIWNNREHHTCSECNHVVNYEPCYHYCPFCGAKMESEGE